MAKISNPMASDNPWNAGFSNLGLALFGDTTGATADKAQLGAYREAETTKTYDEINRKLRADKAINDLSTAMSTVFNGPQGADPAQWAKAMPYLSQFAIQGDYDPSKLAALFQMEGGYGGDANAARRGQVGAGHDPGLDFAISQQEAEDITRHKAFDLSPGQTHVVPPSRFDQVASTTPTTGTTTPSIDVQQTPMQPMPHQAPEVYKQMILDEAEAAGVDPNVLTELLWRESKFNLGAKGAAGERGMAQSMVDTAAAPGLGVAPYTPGVDPGDDIRFGAQYLGALLKKYGSYDKALTAYNWGMGNYEKGGIGGRPASTTDYVTQILTNAGLQPDQQAGVQTASATSTTAAAPVQVADASGAIPDIFGPQGGSYTAPKPVVPTEVSPNASLAMPNASGGYDTVYQAPGAPDKVGATTKVTQPTPADDQRIRELLSNQLGVSMDDFTQNVLGKLPDADFHAYVKAVDDAWNISNGNINDAVAAGLNWVKGHYDVAPAKDTWMPFDATPTTITPVTAPPATTQTAPSAGTVQAAPAAPAATVMPAKENRVVGQVYDTPAHGPLRWTGVAGAEWEEP